MNKTQMRLVVLVLSLVVAGIAYFFFNNSTEPPSGRPWNQSTDGYPHLRWGNPSRAVEDPSDKNNFLMKKKYFALSYNNTKGTPNWVSWRLASEDLGGAPRFPFTPDPDLPPGFTTVTTHDYGGSGFDRGHMCPHADRASDDEASKATFVMTNIVPQSSANNEKAWEQFEEYCRSLIAKPGTELYIVAGPQGEGGASRKGFLQVLHGKDGEITVPAKTWKVVMVIDGGEAPGPTTRLIAVVTPNDETVGEDWGRYRASVRAVETLTGYTFFDRADPSVIGPLKETMDASPVPPPHDHGR